MQASLKFAAVLLALSAISAPAMADGRDHGRGHDRGNDHGWSDRQGRGNDHGWNDGRGRNDRGWNNGRGDGRYDRRDAYRNGYRDGYRDDRRYDRRDDRYASRTVYRDRYYVAPRPIYRGPPRWARGGRYYDRGYGPTYVVNDYYGYGLRRPPHGYYWRRSDAGDFLLVALTTGIIADLVLHH